MHSTIQLYHFFILFVKAKTTKSKIVYKKRARDFLLALNFNYSAFSSATTSASTASATALLPST